VSRARRRTRAVPVLAAVAVTAQACIPPGISHAPRIRDGTHLAVTLVQQPVEDDELDPTIALTLRTASASRRAGRMGQQFGVILPLPAITQALEDDDDDFPVLYLLTGEYYQETEHARHEARPRGWGLQASLFSLAPYAKFGWYAERGGVHVTNAVGAYGGLFGVFTPEVIVWWPYVTLEAAPFSHAAGMFHIGGSVAYEVDEGSFDYGLVVGATTSFGRTR